MENNKQMYHVVRVHVPHRSHEKLLKAVTGSFPVSVKLDLLGDPEHKIFVTTGQKKKIEAAIAAGRRDMTIRLSAKQAKYNMESEGGFLGAMLSAATRFLPAILAGLAAGTAEYHSNGNGMFLGRRNHTYQIRQSGEGLMITPVEHQKMQGFYVRHGEKIFKGKGILHALFGQLPLLNLLF